MSFNPSDLRHMRISIHKFGVIFQFLALSERFDTAAGRSVGAPQPDVAIVGAGEYVFVIRGEYGGEDALHTFGMIYILGMSLVAVPEADTAIIGRTHEFLAGRTEFHIHDRCNVVFKDVQRAVKIPHVEEVDVVVFAGGGEIERFHGIPAEFIGRECEGGTA